MDPDTEGMYRCHADNDVGDPAISEVVISVRVSHSEISDYCLSLPQVTASFFGEYSRCTRAFNWGCP